MPPIVADLKSRCITDGWHRVRSHRRNYRGDGEVLVILRDYPDRAAMIEDAVRMNADHGRRLDVRDRERAARMLLEVGMTTTLIAVTLCTTEKKVNKYLVNHSVVARTTPGVVPGTNALPLKVCARHFAGQRMTKAQAQVVMSASGRPPLQDANSLADLLNEGVLDLTNEKLVAALVKLYQAIKAAGLV